MDTLLHEQAPLSISSQMRPLRGDGAAKFTKTRNFCELWM